MAISLDNVMEMPRDKLRTFKHPTDFDVTNMGMGRNQRLTVYRRPIPGHLYVIGADFAQGMEDKDYDGAIVLDKNTFPVEQVAELHGRWGPDRFDRLLYCLARFFGNAFIVGERQFGLPVLRSLINNLHYHYLYYQRDEASKGRSRMDVLGHYKGPGDPTIPAFRMAVRDRQIILRSEVAREEVKMFQFRPKSEKTDIADLRDSDMKMGAPVGMFDDLVNAGAYAWKGACEVHAFAEHREEFVEGKAGAALGMEKVLGVEKKPTPASVFRGYSRK